MKTLRRIKKAILKEYDGRKREIDMGEYFDPFDLITSAPPKQEEDKWWRVFSSAMPDACIVDCKLEFDVL